MTTRTHRPASRVLATNDMCCSTDPTVTSFGHLPGYNGLRQCVERLREGRAALWVDVGDFAQGGPVAPLTEGVGGFEAAAALPIDVAVAGNHEFDWGIPHLERCASSLPFPLLAANARTRLPSRTVIDLGTCAVGVAGVTYPGRELLPSATLNQTRTAAEALLAECRAVRDDGADIVVAAIHQGVPFGATPTRPAPGEEISALCGDLAEAADLLIGGHTLVRYLGTICGVPYLQPFSHGYEVGVCDLAPGGHKLRTVRTPQGAAWRGYGADLVARAQADVVGHLPRALYSAPRRDVTLPNWIAHCLGWANSTHAALFPGYTLTMQQPPVDGMLGYLPAGPVTRADLLRLYPWAGDNTVILDCAGIDLRQLAAVLDGPWGDCGISCTTSTPATLCVPAYHMPAIEAWAGTVLAAEPAPCGVLAAMAATLATSP
jgi:hypothetical protein